MKNMIEVFTTDVQNELQAERVLQALEKRFPALKINFDLADAAAGYSCGHTILPAEGAVLHADVIISAASEAGFICAVSEDKICN